MRKMTKNTETVNSEPVAEKVVDQTVNQATQAPSAPVQTISEAELKSIIEVPSMFINRFYMALLDGAVVKITFVEEASDKKHIVPRFSAAMSISGFMNFAQIVQNSHNALMQQIMQ